jgi:hypothetical protein
MRKTKSVGSKFDPLFVEVYEIVENNCLLEASRGCYSVKG